MCFKRHAWFAFLLRRLLHSLGIVLSHISPAYEDRLLTRVPFKSPIATLMRSEPPDDVPIFLMLTLKGVYRLLTVVFDIE